MADVSLELLTKGRSLATRLGVKLEALVIGDKLQGIENQLFPYGVDVVYKVEDARLYPYTSLPHASIVINLFRQIKPQVCLMGATTIGRDLGPRVSSCLHSGLTADCTSLEIGDHTDAMTNKEYHDLELIVNARREYIAMLSNIQQAKEILETEDDVEMREMAKAELDELEPKVPELEEQIKILWTLVVNLFADMEAVKLLLRRQTSPGNQDLRKRIEEVLNEEPPTF